MTALINPFKKADLYFTNRAPFSITDTTTPPHLTPNEESFCIYKMDYQNRSQIGLICLLSLCSESPMKIYPHESTRQENYYLDLWESQNEHSDLMMLIHKEDPEINYFIERLTKAKPDSSITGEDGVRHSLWEINNITCVKELTKTYSQLTKLYIADGHHRYAALQKIGEKAPHFNTLPVLLLCERQINIAPFHRLVLSHNRISTDFICNKLLNYFEIEPSSTAFQPTQHHEIGCYLNSEWFIARLRQPYVEQLKGKNRMGTTILERYIIQTLFQEHDYELDYVGGTNALNTLQARVNINPNTLGFSIAPVSSMDFLSIAESEELFPAHTTCFLPKPSQKMIVYSRKKPKLIKVRSETL
jgi:uncharacterized protein (DUF1015 family)